MNEIPIHRSVGSRQRFVRRLIDAAPIALALIAIALCGNMLATRMGTWGPNQAGLSQLLQFCGSGDQATGSCDGVTNSAWGAIDLQLGSRLLVVPTSFLGLVYFLGLLFYFVGFGAEAYRARKMRWVTAALVFAGFAVSVGLVGIMAFALRRWCGLCALVHGINVLLAVCVWLRLALSRADVAVSPCIQQRGLPTERQPALLAILATVIAAVLGWGFFDSASEARRQWGKVADLRTILGDLRDNPRLVIGEFLAQPIHHAGVMGTGEEEDAGEHHAIVFSDFRIGQSRCFEGAWQESITPAFGEPTRVIFKTAMPITASSNFDPRTLTGPELATVAAAAAQMQRNAVALHAFRRALAQTGSSLTFEECAGLVGESGLDVVGWMKDVNSDALRATLANDVALATAMGIDEMPAVILDGRRVPAICLQSLTFWERAADALREEYQAQVAMSEAAGATP